MGKKHKHADLIKAWADGEVIEVRDGETGIWRVDTSPSWFVYDEGNIRIKTKLPDLLTSPGSLYVIQVTQDKRAHYFLSDTPTPDGAKDSRAIGRVQIQPLSQEEWDALYCPF